MNKIPLPPGVQLPEKVSQDDVTFILSTTLIRQHALDPNVINFIRHYLECRAPREAARRSGLRPQDGEHLLKRPDIYEAIRKVTDLSVMKHGYDASQVVARVKEMANFDPAELENEDGSFVESLRKLSFETRMAIKKFKAKNIYEKDPNGMDVVVGKLIEVEFWDKMRANELLGREKDLFVEKKKVEHGLSANMRDVLLESRRLADNFVAQVEAPKTPEIDVTPTKDEKNEMG